MDRIAWLRTIVGDLEARVSRLSPSDRTSPSAIRTALELLRRQARLLTTDLPWLDDSDRSRYAAAGPSRRDFDRATGRTGAR